MLVNVHTSNIHHRKCVCACVCMCAFVCACVFIYLFVYVDVCAERTACVCVFACVRRVRMCVHACVYIFRRRHNTLFILVKHKTSKRKETALSMRHIRDCATIIY